MYRDPIVAETRRLREEYASQFGHDMDAIFADIQKRQRSSRAPVVTLWPKKPRTALGTVDCVGVPGPLAQRGAARTSAHIDTPR